MGNPSAPRGLKVAGRKLWSSIAGTYQLRPDELRILEDAAFEADLIEVLKSAGEDSLVRVRGSQGQDVIDPVISELRQHRATLSRLIAQLKLPDVDQPVAARPGRATSARAAAQSRWNTPGERGA